LEQVQAPISQRIKFLLEHFGLSARSFSRALGVPDNNTQNYIGAKPAVPNADYLGQIVLHFQSVSPFWLLTGQGEPFVSHTPAMNNDNKASIKKTRGNVQANSGQTVNNITMEDCQRDLAICRAELEGARNEIKLLREQLEIKASLVAAKDETISALHITLERLAK
jgi:DNA-binding transcriptional regulator YiaG